MRLIKSRWIHKYESDVNNTIALINSITLDVVHTDSEVWELIEFCNVPVTVNEILERYPKTEADEVNEVIDILIQKKMLVNETSDELKEYFSNKINAVDALGKRGKIASVRILLTEQCNLRCTYCFIDHKSTYMDVDTLYNILEKLIESSDKKHVDIQFFGGEPLLKFDLIKLAVSYMRRAQEKGRIKTVGYNLTTNGTMITDEIAIFLAENKFNISVSLDGPKEINDAKRVYKGGQGSFDKAIAGYYKLKEHSCDDVGFLLTATPSNVQHIFEFFKEASNVYNVNFFAINTPQPSEIGWGVDGIEYAKQTIESYELSLENGVPFSSTLSKVVIALNSKKGTLSSCFNPQGNRCASITTKGEVSPCIVSWEKEFLKPLEKLNDPNIFMNESYVPQPKNCLECPAINICGGPCHLENMYMDRGGVWDNNRCEYFAKSLEWAVWNMDKVQLGS